jgi:hypothetical protein
VSEWRPGVASLYRAARGGISPPRAAPVPSGVAKTKINALIQQAWTTFQKDFEARGFRQEHDIHRASASSPHPEGGGKKLGEGPQAAEDSNPHV